MKHKRILGIDPGLARLGWAVIEHTSHHDRLVGCGCLETPARTETAQRLFTLYQRLNNIFREYHPQVVAVEQLFFTKNVSTAMAVGQARGVVLLAAMVAKVRVMEFTPTSIKQAVTGDGRADKRQIQRMIKLLFNLQRLPRHDDTTDAIAIAWCGASTRVVH